MKTDPSTAKAIAGALRVTIEAHGPITKRLVGSAVKRILCQLKALEKQSASRVSSKG